MFVSLFLFSFFSFHRLLHSERGEVPDVPAIYFCQPTEENLVRIGQDFNDGLYSSYYLNFISPISRQKMEDLALAALQAGCQTNIKKVRQDDYGLIELQYGIKENLYFEHKKIIFIMCYMWCRQALLMGTASQLYSIMVQLIIS